MEEITVLDCTLRDGGYVNEWKFGMSNIRKVIWKLTQAKIDIVEVGFLTEKIAGDYQGDISKYRTVEQAEALLPNDQEQTMYVCMINYGEYSIECLPQCDMHGITGIRIAFHKKDMDAAIQYARQVKEKDYLVFIQPMVAMSYSDKEILQLLDYVNDLMPFAFYIVDSFGTMRTTDLLRIFALIEHNLNQEIGIGYHSHNNMQLAFSNTQSLVERRKRHRLIIDTSILGMGRGAGNLNTELFIDYVNDYAGKNYSTREILQIMDEVIHDIYEKYRWGYSFPHYLSAKWNCHPNYATFLMKKQTLNVEDIDQILSKINASDRQNYSKQVIENLYMQYQKNMISKENSLERLRNLLSDKKVLLIAPGRSSELEKDKICDVMKEQDVCVISVNFSYPYADKGYVFVSNKRRYAELENKQMERMIVTSNIGMDCAAYTVDYDQLLNPHEHIRDNAAMMLLKLLALVGARKVLLAGLDGYAQENNYISSYRELIDTSEYANKNEEMICCLREFKSMMEIEFVTTSKFITL